MNDLVDFKIAAKFEKAIAAGRKKAGKKIGGAFTKKRRGSLGKAQKRRKKGVINRVARDGTLILYDMAPMAHAKEFGSTIKPVNAPQLYVQVSKLAPGELPVRRGDYLLGVSKGKEPRLLGVYKSEVTKKQAAPSDRFYEQVEKFADDYEKALDEFIDGKDIIL